MLTNLRHADDTTLIAGTNEDIIVIIERVNENK